jgi:pyridoxal phosphate enzyme (YggS family)
VTRRDDLAANLSAVRARISSAAAAAGRDPGEVTLVAVTKTRPASDVRLLAGLGVLDVGENRDQEAAPKAALCADLGITWHFVGRLQSNKCRSVASYAHVVHSVDRPKLVGALADAVARADREVGVLLQVSLDAAPGRGGAPPAELPALADAVSAAPRLRLRGVMAVVPLGAPPRPAFEQLAELSAQLRRDHPDADWISAGMTEDLEDAILFGATHVRVGSALLGSRPALR